ncbi:1-acylglycerol-3-phosphate O-acyltransferase Pnpla3-like [Toxorhynchites rutilus septentrionalis]|uniref:1-acylglycerol-3-phosphate O-acyltransferase Pnpla3-like n=1 Tax=Toxorhynchites rutilus septentrionalis TaxID=329112 RepID=UPI0024794305|nr:1-acylglycerol-3-phosphate O-acyltransferase Pnpla3-like [Toxorhynchites rutilus septentrionalis]
MATKMNLSFAGCGFLGIYHVGVAVCFKKYAPHLLLHRISGASAGALAACCLLCDMPLGEMTSDFFRVVKEARSHSLGPFSPRFNIQTCLLDGLQKFLPADAHERVNGKLHISLTRVYDGKNVIVSQFNTREDLLQALLCACFIPFFSGILPPRFHGVRYMDGAFSDNLPTLDENTVTVSPFCGESDICPRDNSSQMFHVNWANTSIELSKENINRFRRILFPPSPEILSSFCQQGFDDALNFLHRNNLISCTRCLSVQSTFCVSDQPKQLEEQLLEEYDPECNECKECTQHRQNALVGMMPDTVLTVIQAAVDQANKGLMNWIFRHRGAKLLKALSLPATLPADIMLATLTKLMVATPAIGTQLWSASKLALKTLNSILVKVRRRQQLAANLQCQIAYTEYMGSGGQRKASQVRLHTQRCTTSSLLDVRVDDGSDLIAVTSDNNNTNIMDHHHHYHYRHYFGGQYEHHPDHPNEDHPDYDTFDHILQATTHHDAMYAYYYLDDNNKVKVTEIFDMTDEGDAALQMAHERELNEQLEFDDWTTQQDCDPQSMIRCLWNPWTSSSFDRHPYTVCMSPLGYYRVSLFPLPDYVLADPYAGDEIIDLDEFIEPVDHYHPTINNHPHDWYPQPQPAKDGPLSPLMTATVNQQWECTKLQIDELGCDDTYFQPEADQQQQTLVSEAAAILLSKPPPVYTIVEM